MFDSIRDCSEELQSVYSFMRTRKEKMAPPKEPPLKQTPPPRQSTSEFQWDGLIEHLPVKESTKRWILDGAQKGQRSEAEMTVINALVWSGLTDEQIFGVFEAYPIGERFREERKSRETWLQPQIDKARAHTTDRATSSTREENFSQDRCGAWGQPEPLKNSIPEAPPLPLDCLPGVIANFCRDTADRMQVRIDSIVIPVLVTLAGVIGKHPLIFPRAKDNWKERICFWGCLILPPGMKKSPAIDAGTAPLRIIQRRYAEENKHLLDDWNKAFSVAKQKHKAWEKACQTKLKDDPKAEITTDDPMNELPPKPVQKRMYTADCTIEKLVDLMNRSPGLTQVSDELAGFLLNMNRYSSGSDRQFYLKCKTGGGHPVDRIGRGEEFVDDLYLNIIGGIQPKVAKQLFSPKESATDDGFFERFGLMVYPAPMTTYNHIDQYPDRAARDAYYKICEKLAACNWEDILTADEYLPGKGIARFDSEAQEAFNQWDVKHGRAMLALNDDESINTMLSKAPGLLVQLAFEFHLVDWASGICVDVSAVNLRSFERAKKFLTEYLIPMWKRILAAFADDGGNASAMKIAKWLIQDKIKMFKIRDIKQKDWSNIKKDDEIEPSKLILIEKNWIKEVAIKPPAGGRPTTEYHVNPSVFDMIVK